MIEPPKTLPPWLVIKMSKYSKMYITYEYISNKGYYKLRYRGWVKKVTTVQDTVGLTEKLPFLVPTQSNMVSSETHTVWYFDTEQEVCDFVTCMLQLEM